MLPSMLRDSNPLIRYGAAAAIVFVPLYVAANYGMRTAWILAIVVAAWFFIKTSNSLSVW